MAAVRSASLVLTTTGNCNRLTDVDEMWHCVAHWLLTAERWLKFRIFEIQDDGTAAASVKTTKLAIYPQWFDRSLRNWHGDACWSPRACNKV